MGIVAAHLEANVRLGKGIVIMTMIASLENAAKTIVTRNASLHLNPPMIVARRVCARQILI